MAHFALRGATNEKWRTSMIKFNICKLLDNPKEVSLENPLPKVTREIPSLLDGIFCWKMCLKKDFGIRLWDLLLCVRENGLCDSSSRSSLTGLMSVCVKSIWMNLGVGEERAGTLGKEKHQPTGRKRARREVNRQVWPWMEGNAFANANRGKSDCEISYHKISLAR